MRFQKYIIFILLLAMSLAITIPALAQTQTNTKSGIFDKMGGAISGFDLPSGGENPDEAAQGIIGRLISAFLSLFGIIFMVLMIYGGYKWMMARGNDDEVTKAKSLIRGAVIGLIIVLSAYAISLFVATAVQQATK